MPLNINTSNYINSQLTGQANNQSVVSGAQTSSTDGVIVSVKGLDLQAGQTLSGKIVEIDGKEVKLLLSNEQTINAKLEGNINALLGQTLSFEVKSSENGQTALRPLYTNLNNSETVSNALNNAQLPQTEQYLKMVSSMMDEGLPINKNAIYNMAKSVNSFPDANPETIVQLNKLGLQINELTINQYENYKGLEHQIIGDVDKISQGLSDLLKESVSDIAKDHSIELIDEQETQLLNENVKPEGKNLLSAFLDAIIGGEKTPDKTDLSLDSSEKTEVSTSLDKALEEGIDSENSESVANTDLTNNNPISSEAFNTAKQIIDLIDTDENELEMPEVSEKLKALADEIKNLSNENYNEINQKSDSNNNNIGKDSLLRSLVSEEPAKELIKSDNIIDIAKSVLDEMNSSPEKITNDVKHKLVQLLSSKEFSTIIKDTLSKQMLLKPEEVVNSKNIDELYTKITRQANLAMEILSNSGGDNKELMASAKNINDNVTFMNELNQVVTYVQLPLLMNNKSAHGDLYVYTNKKSLKNNDGNISALLHLDMDNLGPMDIYVALTNGTKLNTHFYLQDDATIDFIEAHIDALNDRLTKKGYNVGVDISVKDGNKSKTNIAKEFMKDDPGQEGVSVSKFSFDVRA